jgi:hypothetical protein
MRKELIGVTTIHRRGFLYIPNDALEKMGIPREKIRKASVKIAMYYIESEGVQGILLRPIQVIED